jgi:uncharacterized protein (DUF2267 family)
MATDYAEFIGTVEREAEVPWQTAERAASATLETLGERISGGEARYLAQQLPHGLREVVDEHAGDGPQGFSAAEFLQRVQAREHVPIGQAQRHVRAVFAALRHTVSDDEIATLASELPRELEMLLFDDEPLAEDAPRSADEFLARVGRRTGLDEDGARRATAAVLELLAFRLAAGETHDLMQRLPSDLHPPLRRGMAEKPDPDAHWLPLKPFLIAVAAREDVPRAAARLHVRAVLATLTEAVGDDEIEDVKAQLPHEYRSLFPRR